MNGASLLFSGFNASQTLFIPASQMSSNYRFLIEALEYAGGRCR